MGIYYETSDVITLMYKEEFWGLLFWHLASCIIQTASMVKRIIISMVS